LIIILPFSSLYSLSHSYIHCEYFSSLISFHICTYRILYHHMLSWNRTSGRFIAAAHGSRVSSQIALILVAYLEEASSRTWISNCFCVVDTVIIGSANVWFGLEAARLHLGRQNRPSYIRHRLLGITVSNASIWHSLDCTTPSRLAYHIAMVHLYPLNNGNITNYTPGRHHAPPTSLLPPLHRPREPHAILVRLDSNRPRLALRNLLDCGCRAFELRLRWPLF
jgi:hypothetical protein